MKILVVEDERKIREFLQKGLTESGYVVETAQSGTSGEMMASENEYDLIVLDIQLPEQNGLDTARNLRSNGFTGAILMLTALGQTRDKVRGLDAGADDYLTKPFSFDELLARIRALLRRNQPAQSSTLRIADLELDLLKRRVTRAGEVIELTNKEHSLLEYLMRNVGRVLTRAQISEHVWESTFDHGSNVIDVTVNLLRKKIDQPFNQKLLHTVTGQGYVIRDE